MSKLEVYTAVIEKANNAIILGSEKQGSFTNLYFESTDFAKEGVEAELDDHAFASHNNLFQEKVSGEYFFTFINR
jgi:hypothetical protein